MPIITSKLRQKQKVLIELDLETLNQINNYCEWAQIENLNHFLEEAAYFLFSKDKQFKIYQKSLKRHDNTKRKDCSD